MQELITQVNPEKQNQNSKANLFDKLRTSVTTKKNNYEARIPRKLAQSICNVSTNTLVKLEKDGVIEPVTKKHGKLDIITYSVSDIQKIFKYKKMYFKQKEEAEVISIFSQKGGVGKSAFTQHLGSMLSLVGKVLIVDLDAQSDATVLYGLDPNYGDIVEEDDELDPTIAELMDWTLDGGEEGPYDSLNFVDVVKSVSKNIDVIPSDLELGEINYSLNRLPLQNRENEDGKMEPPQIHMIKEVLDKIKNNYDFILIDCPPNIETCNVSALFASNRVLIPLELEAKSLTTMRRNALFLERLGEIHPGFNWDKVLVVPNKFRNENIKIKALVATQDRYSNSEFISLSQVVVPNSSIIDKCSDWKKPVFSATHRYNGTPKSSINQAKEFTNLFWGVMHDILDLDLEYLIFDNDKGE